MAPADYYAFHIIHMHRDFSNGSLGLRRIADTWLLDQNLSNDELEEAHSLLSKMNLEVFSQKMLWLGQTCMGKEPLNDDSELLLAHAMTTGVYGTARSYKAVRITKMSKGSVASGKLRSAVAAILPPYHRMKALFPELEKHPVLLPICWGKRAAGFLLSGNVALYRRMLDYRDVGKEDVTKMRRLFEIGGVQYGQSTHKACKD